MVFQMSNLVLRGNETPQSSPVQDSRGFCCLHSWKVALISVALSTPNSATMALKIWTRASGVGRHPRRGLPPEAADLVSGLSGQSQVTLRAALRTFWKSSRENCSFIHLLISGQLPECKKEKEGERERKIEREKK